MIRGVRASPSALILLGAGTCAADRHEPGRRCAESELGFINLALPFRHEFRGLGLGHRVDR